MPNNDQKLRFYEIMKYPIPIQEDFFYFKKEDIKKSNKNTKKNWKQQARKKLPKIDTKNFSRAKKNPLMEEYTTYIKKYRWLYHSLPFIEQIYLCNSITFNALNKNSDIDLFFICKKGSIRRARFFSVVFFSFLNLKRNKKYQAKKFCLTFYITNDNQKLSSIKLKKEVYLPYRISHLVLLYQQDKKITHNFFKDNQRVEEYLPNYQIQQTINIGIKPTIWNTQIKKILENIFNWKIGKRIEKIIKQIRKPIVIKKKNKLKLGKKYIIIQDNILKYYLDQREDISENFYSKNI